MANKRFGRVSADFSTYTRNGRAYPVKVITGLSAQALRHFWSTYCVLNPVNRLWLRGSCPLRTPEDLVLLFAYIWVYPTWNCLDFVLGVSRTTFHRRIVTGIRWLALNVRELRPNIRYHPTNHCPGWPTHVTGMVDSFPIYRYSSKDPVKKWGLYSGKYKRCAVKFEVAFDFLAHRLGHILFFSGPHPVKRFDARIFERTIEPFLRDDEFFLGDGHYSGTLRRRCLIPFRKPVYGNLSQDQLYWNLLVSFYRARAEHGIRRIKTPRMFDSIFRGSITFMSQCLKVWVHALACHQRLRRRPYYARSPPAPHFP